MDRARLLRGASAVGPRAVLHRDPAAERHRPPAHRPRAPAFAPGRAGPPRADAGLRDALAPRHGPRGHRDAGRRGAGAAEGRDRPARHRTRGVRRARVAVEGAVRRRDRRPDQADGELARLVARAVHDGRRAVAGRPRGVRPLVRRGPDLPRRAPGQLVPHRSDGPLGLRGGARGRRRRAGHVPVSALGRVGVRRGRHHACGDHARRHRGRGASGRRAVRAARREDRHPSVRRASDPDRRGRARSTPSSGREP